MARLIDKSALVAEIERRKNICQGVAKANENNEFTHLYYKGKTEAYSEMLDFLDTLEVKEVDLDTDFGVCWGEYCDCCGNINDYEVAKHFFELGMAVSNKAQKGE